MIEVPPEQTIDPYESLFAFFAYELRRHRKARGLSQDQLAKELYTTRAAIESYESRRNCPKSEFAKQLDEYFGTGVHFQVLLYYARQESLLKWLNDYVELEKEARESRVFQALNIPGLLQTPEYARAQFESVHLPNAEELIAQRMERQAVLTRSPSPLRLWVLLDQSVIERPVGGPAAMAKQLRHLLEMSEMWNVCIRVVPTSTGAYIGVDGSFIILTTPDQQVGYTEAALAGRLTYEPVELETLGLHYEWIGARALHEEGTRCLIKKKMEAMQ
ncbi:helix-turn-helix domain-containing protein [Spirillospora sp. CA-253888]